MDRRTLTPFPDNVDCDIGLADLFVQNAFAQFQGAQAATTDATPNRALHSTAIAIELLLKSYLLRTATNDAWNRINIGHDLEKAATYAAIAGLTPPPHLRRIIAEIHPHFMRGGFQRDPSRSWPPGLVADAREVAQQLARIIAGQPALERAILSPDRTTIPASRR